MAPARRLALALVVCLLLGLGWATAIQRPCHERSHLRALKQDTAASGDDVSAEQKDVLHRLLHAYFPARYQHGVYPSDDEALDAVRADDAGLATAIARIAKRQNDNTTTASQQPTDGTTTVTSATTVTAAPPDTTSATTTPDNKPPATTTTTTTPDNNPPAETSTMKPPAGGSTTPGNPTGTSPEQPPSSSGARPPSSSASLPSSVVPSSSSPSQGPTSTSGKQTTPSTTPVTTSSLALTLSPSPTTFTSTDPNGNLVIVTSTSFVHVNPTGTKAGSSTSSTPGLQNAAMPMRTGSLLSDPFGALVAGLMVLLAF